MDNACVSVVVPIYNVEKYLDRCLNSIVNQTYRNLEIILVDDGSPDRCPEMCDAWAEKDSRIKVIHKKNAGLGMARNTGIENATGSYICFCDSDDYMHENTVEKACEAIIRNDVEIVMFGLSRISSQGAVIRHVSPETDKTVFRAEEVQNVFLLDLIDPDCEDARNKNLSLSACVCLFSMELIRRTGWRFVSERDIISEDSYSLIWLYRYVNSVAILPESFYCYCENTASLTQTYRPERFDRIRDFYVTCTDMAEQIGHNGKVCARISGLFLSFSIAAMKQIAASDLPGRKKKAELAKIVADEKMQAILADPNCRYNNKMRNILFWAMRKKLYSIVCCLTALQVLKERICR